MKLFLFFLIWVPMIFSCQKNHNEQILPKTLSYSESCSYDILEIIGHKPEHIDIQSCSFYKNSQVLFSATYALSGIHAAETEAYLISHFEMGTLSFVCCGWETKNKSGYLRSVNSDNDYTLLEIDMYSQETLIQDRSQWNEIDTFYISTRIIEI